MKGALLSISDRFARKQSKAVSRERNSSSVPFIRAVAEATRRFSKVWDHAANKRKALFLSSWNCSIARVGEGETDFNILSAKPIREEMFRGASSLRFV
jgi:hypothetical protein